MKEGRGQRWLLKSYISVYFTVYALLLQLIFCHNFSFKKIKHWSSTEPTNTLTRGNTKIGRTKVIFVMSIQIKYILFYTFCSRNCHFVLPDISSIYICSLNTEIHWRFSKIALQNMCKLLQISALFPIQRFLPNLGFSSEIYFL